MHVRRDAVQIEVLAPAKINLFLEVLARRADGYHEIETLMARVSVYDSLFFEATEGGQIVLECRWGAGWQGTAGRASSGTQAAHVTAGLAGSDTEAAGLASSGIQTDVARGGVARELHADTVPCGPENLAWRAAALLKERAGERQGARIRLIKRIPAAAGLGGASSDAAAALVAANAGWGLGWPRERLVELARELGSDVSFFLVDRAGLGRGRGERIEEVPTTRLPMVIVKPPVGLSTPKVYQACQPSEQPRSVSGCCEQLARGRGAELGRGLVNRLQAPAGGLTPWIGRLAAEFSRQPVDGHQMSGSGSSYFGICRTSRQARRLAAVLRARGLGAVMAGALGRS
jgi:4-diphosphocytidyl-2-C-methyl-D-erythritol kinase